MPQTGRLYLCARCREQVVVCRPCDHGQIYCFDGCAALARRERQRAAARAYQASRRGRFAHAQRSRRYRQRRRSEAQNVTHQGSVACAADALLHSTATMTPAAAIQTYASPAAPAEAVANEAKRSVPAEIHPCCSQCCAPCAGGLRSGFVRYRFAVWAPPLTYRDDHRL